MVSGNPEKQCLEIQLRTAANKEIYHCILLLIKIL